ncbi:FIST N-terminal domain-containing protein [Pleomorphomonas oryzae]|uniref:FIST N-terminal domain-containing protein n=1 Tax=Pleomorphomonas oryzae TaxID=261934 RepID=UPI000405A444|nr:FIST N-terminal domain-containing protein [Pleomorphomonas oryzae]
MRDPIRRFQSISTNARTAVREFRDGVSQPNMAFVLFFCSSAYELDEIAEEMALGFPGVTVFGCTTAGEIGPEGYLTYSLSGASFPRDSFAAVGRLVPDLQRFEPASARIHVQSLLLELDAETADRPRLVNRFALSLIDGLSIREELVGRAFQSALDDICLIGGSAGDDLNFRRTHVYADGGFHTDAAVVMLIATSRPFRAVKIQNFTPMQERLVVTAAEPERRLVREINGLPATEEYARATDTTPKGLGPARFAAAPIVVFLSGSQYVRAVQTAHGDGSLTFYCAVDEGMVFRIASMTDLLSDLKAALAEIRDAIGRPKLLIGFDCILRKLTISAKSLTRDVEHLFEENNVVGFSCYGEQYQGIHVNHTLTGVAIGDLPEDTRHG